MTTKRDTAMLLRIKLQAHPGKTIAQLARFYSISPTTVTKYLKDLVQRKLVRFEKQGKTKRYYPI